MLLTSIYKISNLVIAFSYFSIPVMVLVLWRRRRNDVAESWILLLFAAFIFFCGLTHLSDVMVFYWAPYRLYTLLYSITGLLSFLTVCCLPHVILSILKLPSRDLIHKLNGDLNRLVLQNQLENQQLNERNQKLINRIQVLEGMLESNAWIHDKGMALQQLKEMLITIGTEKKPNGS